MEFLAALFTGVGLLWLAFWVTLFVAALVCAEWERPGIFSILVGIGFCWAVWRADWEPINWVLTHKAAILAVAGVYLIAGILWSFFKWDRFCAHEAERQRALVPRPMVIPQAAANKRKFGTWIFLWWASVINFVLHDVAVEVRDWVLRQFGGVYASIAQRHFR